MTACFSSSSLNNTAVTRGAAEVVIVGGGPVGLWFAIQLRMRQPALKLAIVEQYSACSRQHLVRIARDAFDYSLFNEDLLQRIFENTDPQHAYRPLNVLTAEWESKLRQLCVGALQIPIIQMRVNSMQQLIDAFPNLHFIVGADGACSTVATEVFQNCTKVESVLAHTIEVRYPVQGRTRLMDELYEALPTLKLMQCAAKEFINAPVSGTEEKQHQSVTLILQVKQSEYETMKLATAQSSWYLHKDQHRIPPRVLQSLLLWLNVKKMLCGEVALTQQIGIVAVPMSASIGDGVYKTITLLNQEQHNRPVHVFRIGDAALRLPFLRGLSAGMKTANILARSWECNDKIDDEWATQFATQFRLLAQEEWRSLANKTTTLMFQGLGAFLHTERQIAIPLQQFKWCHCVIRFLRTNPQFVFATNLCYKPESHCACQRHSSSSSSVIQNRQTVQHNLLKDKSLPVLVKSSSKIFK